jgi:hypothetical protein
MVWTNENLKLRKQIGQACRPNFKWGSQFLTIASDRVRSEQTGWSLPGCTNAHSIFASELQRADEHAILETAT